MKYCERCGSLAWDEAASCPACGSHVLSDGAESGGELRGAMLLACSERPELLESWQGLKGALGDVAPHLMRDNMLVAALGMGVPHVHEGEGYVRMALSEGRYPFPAPLVDDVTDALTAAARLVEDPAAFAAEPPAPLDRSASPAGEDAPEPAPEAPAPKEEAPEPAPVAADPVVAPSPVASSRSATVSTGSYVPPRVSAPPVTSRPQTYSTWSGSATTKTSTLHSVMSFIGSLRGCIFPVVVTALVIWVIYKMVTDEVGFGLGIIWLLFHPQIVFFIFIGLCVLKFISEE